MQLEIVWYVLAGFLLGFVVSTLWEWIFFRRERMKIRDGRLLELEALLAERETAAVDTGANREDVPLPWRSHEIPAQEYHSPGVFLETEEVRSVIQGSSDRVATPLVDSGTEYPGEEATRLAETVEPSVQSSQGDERFRRRPFPSVSVGDTEVRSQSLSEQVESTQVAPEPVVEAQGASRFVAAGSLVDPSGLDSDRAGDDNDSDRTIDRDADRDDGTVEARLVNPYASYRRSPNFPDDLTKIKGIGDVYRQRLYAAGIYTWRQIADAELNTLRAATQAYPSSNVDEWGPQARLLAEKHGRENARYTGPLPDDLTKIIGIGPVGAQTLFREGICTFEQLAGTAADELSPLFPIAVAGDQPDFDHWLEQAIRLADAKRGN